MYPGSWKSDKTEAFDFCEVSCTGGHENWTKLKCLIFVKFRVPGVMKIRENWSIWFNEVSCTRGHENWTKLKCLIFCEVSCTRGNENWRKLKYLIFVNFCVPGVMKIGQNWSVWFLWSFVYPGSWKLEKIKVFDICEFLCTRGHENWAKLKCLIFVKFRVPGVMKIGEN